MLIDDDERRKRKEEMRKQDEEEEMRKQDEEVISICKKIGDISVYHTGITRSASDLLGSTEVFTFRI